MSEENVTNVAICKKSKPYLKRKNSNDLLKNPKQPRNQNLKVVEANDGEDKATLLTDLPNEILGKILNQVSFGDLFKLERVCKRMRNVVLNFVWPKKKSFTHESIIKYTNYPQILPSSIGNKDEEIKRHKITRKSIKLVLSRTPNIQNIDLSVYSLTIKRGICSLLSMAPKLISLDLSYIRLKNANLVTIARSCPMLEEISLENSFSYKDEFVDGFKKLCKQCPKIKYINLAKNNNQHVFAFLPIALLYLDIFQCYPVTPDAMNILVERVPNLETLIFNYYFHSTTNMNVWLSRLTKLRFLQIDRFSQDLSLPPLNFSSLHELEWLSLLGYGGFITIGTLESLQSCPKLKSLNLGKTFYLGTRALEIIKTYKNLKYFAATLLTSVYKTMLDFIQHNQIQYLDLYQNGRISKNILKSFINDYESLTHLNIWSEEVNYGKSLSSILSETHSPPRKNVLKIIVHPKTTIFSSFSTCKWCEIISWNNAQSQAKPFPDFTNVKIQYHNAKNNII